MVECRNPGCHRRASFGLGSEVSNTRVAEFCSGHAMRGMVDVYQKTCGHPGCNKHPSYGVEGSRTREFCSCHAKPHMVNVSMKKCDHPGCNKYPSYGIDGSKMATSCAQHAAEGMVRVLKRGKIQQGCTETPSLTSVEGTKTEFCPELHAKGGMVVALDKSGGHPGCHTQSAHGTKASKTREFCAAGNVVEDETVVDATSKKRKRCSHPGCNSTALFGVEGSNSTEFCGQHAMRGMVKKVTTKRCGHPGCDATPSFGVEGSKTREFCPKHAKEGMVDVVSRRCSYYGCKAMPSYGLTGSKVAEFCDDHATEGMVNLYYRSRMKLTMASWTIKDAKKRRFSEHARSVKKRGEEEQEEDAKFINRSSSERRGRQKRRVKRPVRRRCTEREDGRPKAAESEVGEKRKRALFLGVTFVEDHHAEFLGEPAKRVRRFKTVEKRLRNKVNEGNMNPLRDTVRVLATETQGYRVSCVSKVSVSGGKASAAKKRGPSSRGHLLEADMSNTTASRGLLRRVRGKWGDIKFETVLLDHFWLPDSETWLNKNYMANDGGLIRNLVSMTKPETRLLSDDFEVILPINRGFLELLLPHFAELDKHFTVAFLVGQALKDFKESHLALQAGDLIPDDVMMGVYGKSKERQVSLLGVKEPTPDMVKVLGDHGVAPGNYCHARFLKLTKRAGTRGPILPRWRRRLWPGSWGIWPMVSHRWRSLRQRYRLTSARRTRVYRSFKRGGFVGEWSSSNCYLASLVVLLASRSRVFG